jgi:Mn-dependent DtxR family transcriptional regulator
MDVFCNLCKETKQIDEYLTDTELKILQYIKKYTQENNKAPTFRKISKELKISLTYVDTILYQLTKKEFIKKKPYTARAIYILKDVPCA